MRRALYLPLTVVGVALGLVSVLLVPLRHGGTLIWAAVAIAVVGAAALCRVGVLLTGRRAGGLVPLLAWLAVVYVLGLTGPGGDVLVPADPALGLVPVYFTTLVAGALAGAVATYLGRPATERSARVPVAATPEQSDGR